VIRCTIKVARLAVATTALALALACTALASGPRTAQATSPSETWYWTANTVIDALRQDYGYDPSVADPNDPWHYDLRTVECRGYGRFIGKRSERYFQRFACKLTYVATDATIPNDIQTIGVRVTGRYDHQEYEAPPEVGPAEPGDRTERVLLGYSNWSPVDGDKSPSWLSRPHNLLLLGPSHVLADSPMIWRINWSRWGAERAYGVGRSRTKIYDPWARVRLVAHRVRTCGDTKTYTRVTASFTYESDGRTRTGTSTWSMQPCAVRLR
jgi:hypothetical protein